MKFNCISCWILDLFNSPDTADVDYDNDSDTSQNAITNEVESK